MHRIDRGESKPQKSKLNKQAFEAQINAENNPCCTKGAWTMPMMINMSTLDGTAIGGSHGVSLRKGAK